MWLSAQDLVALVSCLFLVTSVAAWSTEQLPSRRDVLLASGGLIYTKFAVDVLSRATRTGYPAAHEQRVAATISRAFTAAVREERPLRVLEVGIGDECRLLRRDLYHEAFQKAQALGVNGIQLTGIDLVSPKKEPLKEVRTRLRDEDIPVQLNVQKADITQSQPSLVGYFDCVICCLTLCSVQDPAAAVETIKSMVRPNGGTFGYVEHVAVEPSEPYRFLDWQQQSLDPLQQAVASNCHLHRHTQDTINSVFAVGSESRFLADERFLVDDMWPVSCQCCGVIQRT